MNGKTILVVEDNPQIVRLLQLQLKHLGVSSLTASNGLEALQLYKNSAFSLIFMDVAMPVMNGLEACIAIREHERENSINPTPIIAVTGQAELKECLDAGMNDLFSKPFLLGDIEQTLLRWLPNSGH